MIGRYLFCLGGLAFAGAAFAQDLPPGDPDAGRKVAGQCRTCHGLDGYAQIPIAPHIGGESETYLVGQLRAFRDGTREHEMMTVVTRGMADQDIADVAAWYSQHEAIATLSADPADAPEACIGCHGTDGIALVDGVPNLAGETNIYIATQLKAYREGKRVHEIMSSVSADLADDDIRRLADWFAAIALEIEPLE
ncbi:Cytochrome c553 [Cognatiyoonia koreensis]|uniref:Cytochrome c553 n=1 Tax=Cognatiyoonia koreensis TaxID=364200 RepID=A0A1I0RHD4_9RHOB|nr:c-type cytochrome [Cognatiyoonia koreensis]SEW40342.1 Cytochrome c553 [Cognatiyoonia koreensis]